mgnify:CR=1 FL=1
MQQVIVIFKRVMARGATGAVVGIDAVLSVSERMQVIDEFDNEVSRILNVDARNVVQKRFQSTDSNVEHKRGALG